MYKIILQQLKRDHDSYNPQQINLDFELAAVKAAKDVFPKSKIQFCQFHMKQSVIRNLGTNGLKQRYETELVFAMEIRQLMAIAFLPEEEVREFTCFHLHKHP